MDGAPWHLALNDCFPNAPSAAANTGHRPPAMVGQ